MHNLYKKKYNKKEEIKTIITEFINDNSFKCLFDKICTKIIIVIKIKDKKNNIS